MDSIDVMSFEEIQKALMLATGSVATMHRQLSAFFSALPDPFFVIGRDGKYLEVLGGNARELYSDGAFLKGKNIAEIFTPRLSGLFSSTIADVIASGRMAVVEYDLGADDLISDGPVAHAWFEGRVAPILDPDGETAAVVWLAINITAKKLAEEKLQSLADRDPLTGAYNRRFFEHALEREHALFERYKAPFSLALLDIDHFKSVNDKFGHDTGDVVLRHLVGVVSSELRTSDLFCRFGGEEFVLILPNTRKDQAMLFAERLREKLAASPASHGSEVVPFTVSIGIGQVDDSDADHHALTKRADLALYSSKALGRNRTTIYTDN